MVTGAACLAPYLWLGELGLPTVQSMTFVVLAISTIFLAISSRREYLPAWTGPFVPYFLWMGIPAVLTVFAVESGFMNDILGTTPLTGDQWGASVLLAFALPAVMELVKAVERRRLAA